MVTAITPHQLTLEEFLQLPETKGSQLGWLIEPEERIILIFQAEKLPLKLSSSDPLPVLSDLELKLTIAQVFDWLKVGIN